ncbi:hypothetical protein SEA_IDENTITYCRISIS_52 [Mycobacterium phage IdentityCrisis]|uniref:Helix-turn-helix DNA binding domain protein n=1 Tax=Mycobacterium phage IdentityCrisis TaxID=2599866 RepID=A0A5J6TGQ8_9CAUD|nr:hypothetical protein QEH37_gp51 [Mycobacterium phage IdentityCrisis]QFG10071.1 hypothetical protein SEA_IDENTITYCRISIS_52 [Mycobacterium phage IdentityCrisis]
MSTTLRVAPNTRGAVRFFWGWLIGSAAVSIAGVVTHAALGHAPSPVIASALAVAIVLIQLSATLGVHVLVQAHITGAAYRCALTIAVAIALGAFVLNFVALRGLAIDQAGITAAIAWIAPLIIDLGMTASTVALLALINAQRAAQLHIAARPEAQTSAAVHVEVHNTVRTDAHTACDDAQPAEDFAHLEIAQRIVMQAGVRIAPERVARVLAVHAQTGATPSVIARQTGVHHRTVQRILDAA